MNLTSIENEVLLLKQSLSGVQKDIDEFFTQNTAVIIFSMQLGFAFLEASCVEIKNVTNILMKNFIDTLVGGIVWYLWGYAFAFGDSDGRISFIGTKYFALSGIPPEQRSEIQVTWFFQFTFTAAATTILSGAIAGRARFFSYLVWSVFCTSWIYPLVTHWVWSSSGWLSAEADPSLRVVGCIDFSGSGVVHLTGGTCALVAAAIIGPRLGRFEEGWDGDKPGTLRTFRSLWSALGAFALWYGWYGFNPGSSRRAIHFSHVNSLASINTTLGGCSSALSTLMIQFYMKNNWDFAKLSNGLLAGLVAVTAGCSTLPPWGAIIAGIIAGQLYFGATKLLYRLRIDDPVEACAVHCVNGFWGMLVVGLLADKDSILDSYPGSGGGLGYGLFMGGGGKLLGAQVLTIVIIILWSVACSLPFFFVLNKFGYMRVNADVESVGLDLEHVEMTAQQKRLLKQGPFRYNRKKHASMSANQNGTTSNSKNITQTNTVPENEIINS